MHLDARTTPRAEEVSVVIPAAGSGSRLGRRSPKALVECAGRTVLEWQLALCRDVDQVILVVGFRGREVAEHAIQLRPEITIATNEYFSSTVAGSSVAIGATVAHHERLIVLNGDVLVHPDDWVRVLSHGNPFVGVSEAVSRDAVYVEEDPCGSSVVGFTRRRRHHEHEWTGICGSSRSDWLDGGQGHIYQQLEKSLPMDAVHLRTAEIDYPEDLLSADRFARQFLEPALGGC